MALLNSSWNSWLYENENISIIVNVVIVIQFHETILLAEASKGKTWYV